MAGFLAALFGNASSQPGSSSSVQAPTWSFSRLQQLYDRLSQFKESDLDKPGGGDAVVETVRQITEALIWGEQNDTNFFDFFCEKSILADFIRVIGLKRAPKQVKVQLLQTLSMLIQNVRRTTSVFYLLSNNHVNKLIAMNLDFSDEEILAYYITLVKSLAMRLDSQTIKFFFLQLPEPVFPLYIEATKFFRHKDQMVRATVRTITLQVYRIEDTAMRAFVLRHAAESYFSQLACHLRDLWLRMDAAIASASEDDLTAAQHENELQQDLLLYLSDVFELGVMELNDVLADRLLNGALFPVLLSGIVTPPDHQGEEGVLGPAVALFLLRQVIDVFRCPVLIAPLAGTLLEPTVSASLLYALPIVAEIPGAKHPHAERVLNPVRNSFLRFLRGSENVVFLLAAAVVHALVTNRRAVPAAFLHRARIFAPPSEGDEPPQGQQQGGLRKLSAPSPREPDHRAPSSRDPPRILQDVALAPSAARGQQVDCSTPARGEPDTSVTEVPRVAQGASNVALAPQSTRSLPARGYRAPEARVQVLDADQQMEVTLLLLQGLQRYTVWNLETLAGLFRIALDIVLHPSVCHHPGSHAIVSRALRACLRGAAQRLRALIHEGMPDGSDDSILDLFMEEWEHHRAAPVSIAELCGSPARFLLAVAPSRHGAGGRHRGSAKPSVNNLEPTGTSQGTPQKAARCYLLVRRLLADFQKFGPHVPRVLPPDASPHTSPWAAPSEEASPLLLEDIEAHRFKEGMSFEIGRFEKIVCGIAAPNGKHTRYLVLHEYFFILAQPDLASPGWCVVRTLWPLQLVQSLVDRGDPRTLQIGMQTYQACVNPAFSPGLPDIQVGPVLTLNLNFEDVRRCCMANMHLQRKRREVRDSLLRKAAAFVERSLS